MDGVLMGARTHSLKASREASVCVPHLTFCGPRDVPDRLQGPWDERFAVGGRGVGRLSSHHGISRNSNVEFEAHSLLVPPGHIPPVCLSLPPIIIPVLSLTSFPLCLSD